jgi:hypothetical protein
LIAVLGLDLARPAVLAVGVLALAFLALDAVGLDIVVTTVTVESPLSPRAAKRLRRGRASRRRA